MYLKNAALSKPLPVLRTASFGRKDWDLLPGSGGLEETQLNCDSIACFLDSFGTGWGRRRRPCSAFYPQCLTSCLMYSKRSTQLTVQLSVVCLPWSILFWEKGKCILSVPGNPRLPAPAHPAGSEGVPAGGLCSSARRSPCGAALGKESVPLHRLCRAFAEQEPFLVFTFLQKKVT